jgi:hypothetical protein
MRVVAGESVSETDSRATSRADDSANAADRPELSRAAVEYVFRSCCFVREA